jgi:transposase InsO family protein
MRGYCVAGRRTRDLGDTAEFVIGTSGKLYLAVILDLFSRFVVGWALSAANDPHQTIKALEMALKRRCPEAGLLHYSDQGCTPGFKVSSQHRPVRLSISDRQELLPVSSSRASFGSGC